MNFLDWLKKLWNWIEILIDVVEIKENVDEFLLYSLILNFDIYIGVD